MEKGAENWEKAKEWYVKAAEATSVPRDRSRVYCDLSFMLFRLGRKEDQTNYLELAVGADPSDHIAHARLARAYGFAERWEEAARHFTRSLELKPDDDKTRRWQEQMAWARQKKLGS